MYTSFFVGSRRCLSNRVITLLIKIINFVVTFQLITTGIGCSRNTSASRVASHRTFTALLIGRSFQPHL
ncbi:hypothetical protein EG68_09856 [Paragonimus skrjabini miyazakii]|uniref:Uncharacterized protein n=1 Tax=Paragonimus skrjabini miyazakii TaxID=59628 RepID=A0A8S9YGD1_9TREM|nr:hypothetical protein EG68_09856 [Paragonimus skrjabini miyazakii]